MKKYRIVWIILLLVVFIGGVGYGVLNYFSAGRGQKEEPYFDETIVVEKNSFDEFASEIANLINEYDGSKIDEEAFSIPYYSRRLIVQGAGEELDLTLYGAKVVIQGPDDLYVMQFTTREAAEEACGRLQDVPNIEYCEPDQYAGSLESDGDYEAMSWGVNQIGADVYAKHIKGVTNESITVAVVDSGVYKHSFLKDRIAVGGIDFVDNDMNPDDKNSHGTHVAGTIVDCTPGLNVKILPVRVLGADGFGSWLRISLGIRYSVSRGAQIVNLSLGNKGQKGISQTVDNAVLYAINRGCTVVAAAGNDGWDVEDCSIAHLDRCIVVSAVDSNLQKASFSNWGSSVDVAAPGVNIVSCIPNLTGGFTIGGTKIDKSGTSMATPHITALAAMVKLENPSFSPGEVEAEIINHCIDLGETGWDMYYGWGIPDFSDKTDDVKSDISETSDMTSDEQFIEEPVQIEPMKVYQDVLAEYKMLAENNFDSSLKEQVRYANEGVWNFSGQDQYSVYYRLADLAGDGEPELLISINEKETPYNIVDIFGIKDGKLVAVIESHESVGYRSRYYITTDNRIKNVGSGGALNTVIIYYRLQAGSVISEMEDQYIYDGWDGDQYTHIDSGGVSESISEDEYMYFSSGEDVDFENEWTLLYEGDFIHYAE